MPGIRRILVVVDPSLQWTPALRKAIALARALRANLWLGLFDRGPRLGVLGVLDRAEAHRLEAQMREQVSTRLQDLAKAVREESNLLVDTIDEPVAIDAGRIAAAVVRLDIDLVVKDVEHVSALRRMMFVPIDWDLMRGCPVPVWLASDAKEELPMRIAAAVDPVHTRHGARLNPAILSVAGTIAGAASSRVRVLTCFGGYSPALVPMEPSGAGIPFPSEAAYEELRTEYQSAFRRLLEAHGIPADQGVVLNGMAADMLARAVRDSDVDLLVMGVMHRRGIDRVLMGSTAERLAAHAPCDLLVVPEPPGEVESEAVVPAEQTA